MDDDDDIYGEATYDIEELAPENGPDQAMREPEEESDSDIDIITEKDPIPEKPRPVKAPISTVQTTAPIVEAVPEPAAPVKENALPASSFPAVHMSDVNVNEKPVVEETGRSIFELDMDHDFLEDQQPWRQPGTDLTDFFNYGFDEFTWADYCLKQRTVRQDAAKTKKQLDDMQTFMKAGMPAMGPVPPTELPPAMQKMFAQMMAGGAEPPSAEKPPPNNKHDTYQDREPPKSQGNHSRNYDRDRRRRW